MDERSISAKGNNTFRILVVDDDPAGARVLQEVMKNLQRPYELHYVSDGGEALDFLHRRRAYLDAPRPDLVLLDVNMPRLSGLETLSAIKSDPELCVIPIIMLSTSNSPKDVRNSYQAHANGYVQKPTSLESTMKLVQALESFWMDFVLLPALEDRTPKSRQLSDSKTEDLESHALKLAEVHSGIEIAPERGEARSRAMLIDDSPEGTATPSRKSGCEEHNRLLDEFGVAVREIIDLHEQQFLAIVEGDIDCHRFDLLIHMANEKKQLAKYAYLRHVEEHGCSNFDVLNNIGT
jgi:chemotaxis family two-component system response regulator Rcp1